MQRATGSCQSSKEYDRLLAEAVKLGREHETKAKYFVPKMYDALVRKEGLVPSDAADRIYKDLVGIWQKDTIRRLLPPEAKNQAAREMQALSRFHLESNAGPILQQSRIAAADAHEDNAEVVAMLEQENVKLRKAVEELEAAKKSLLERTLRLEKVLAEEQQHPQREHGANKEEMTVVLPPHLFIKAFALMRSSTKPLVLRVVAGEAADIDKMNA